MRLEGKIAVVTAAGAGIGRACALAMLAEGAVVWATDKDADALAALGDSILTTRVLDVTDSDAVASLFAQIGRCDVLLNAVGIVPSGSVLDTDIETFDAAWAINVKSMIGATKAVLPGMAARGAGSIVNIASVASSITGVPNRCAYGVTKAAVIGLTKSVAADFVAHGVRCNAICPGTIDTPSLRARAAAAPDPEAAMSRFAARQPMNRLGRAEEVAAAAIFLASDESSFVTGQTIAVDGGWTT